MRLGAPDASGRRAPESDPDGDFTLNELFPRVRDLLLEAGRDDILLTGGGIIPKEDMDSLQSTGVARLFGPGTSTQELVDYIREWFAAREQQDA